jgi:glutamyl-tRNA synthetase
MRVRFAPSPTGALHIGGARTALYNWLLARGPRAAGEERTSVLRIEDTDRERSTPENVDQILDALEWLGLDFDEGPIFQSEQRERHAEAVERLLASGAAYRSTAGPEEVKAFKERHGNRGFRGQDEGTGAVRLRMPDEGATVVRDVIRGESSFEHALMDDLVIARADGTPLYHLAVVVDDLDEGITHVVRGADHYSNTPKQMRIIAALGAEPPAYGHLPLLNGPDGRKLSKRHGAASVQELRAAGYLPEAVRNYLALLGWGYDEETTFFTTEELQRHFTLERVSRSPAVFDEQKLRWMNGRYVRELGLDELTARLEALTGRDGLRDAAAITQDKISRSSGRSRAPSSTARRTIPRRAGASSARRRAARCWARCARRSPSCRSPGRSRRSRRHYVTSWRDRTSRPRRSSSRCGWRSRAPPCRRGSSSRSRCSGARRRSPASTPRSPAGRRPDPLPTLRLIRKPVVPIGASDRVRGPRPLKKPRP